MPDGLILALGWSDGFAFFSRFALLSLELVNIVMQKTRFQVRENEDIVGRHYSPVEPTLLGVS